MAEDACELMLEHVESVDCKVCGEQFSPARRARCPQCANGGALRFRYRTRELAPFDRATWARRESWIWRFKELLPLDDDFDPPPLQVGMTPLYGSPALANFAGVRGLFVKDETANPCGTSRARAAALLCAGALGKRAVSGPLSPEMSAFAASAHLRLLALANSDDAARVAHTFGAETLRLLPGAPADAALLAADAGLYLADWPNPLAFEGMKTLGLELGDQLAERAPDWIALDAHVPDAIEAVQQGLRELVELGVLRASPKILAVGGAKDEGDAQVSLDPTELAPAAEVTARALGLPIANDGASTLAGLKRAVAEKRVAPESLCLIVVEGESPFATRSLPALPEVRSSTELRASLGKSQ